jgi:hypothetical protein
MEMGDFLKKALKYYDNQKNKNKNYLDNTTIEDKTIIDLESEKVILKLSKNDVQVLGIFHPESNIFIWGWVPPDFSIDETVLSRELLNYALHLNPISNTNEHSLLKSLLINSRILVKSSLDLELLLAISAYILKDKISFIHHYDLIDESDKRIVIRTYYLVKISNN